MPSRASALTRLGCCGNGIVVDDEEGRKEHFIAVGILDGVLVLEDAPNVVLEDDRWCGILPPAVDGCACTCECRLAQCVPLGVYRVLGTGMSRSQAFAFMSLSSLWG